jgi:Leucine Rich Repeat (LRR) protein
MTDKLDPKQDDLVPTEKREMTRRSSALVRRGLEALSVQGRRIVRFPSDRSMGKLYISDKGLDPLLAQAMLVFAKDHLSDARGDVAIPSGKKLCLKVSDEAAKNLSPFAALNPDDLDMLDLGWTQVTDAELVNVNCLTGLKDLCLGGTQITDVGLANISELIGLERLSLSGTEISDSGVYRLFGHVGISACLDHFGETGPESFSEGMIVYINVDHPVYKDEAQKADTRITHVARLLSQEIAVMRGPIDPQQRITHVEHQGKIPLLEFSDLINVPLSDTGLVEILGLVKLQHLDLSRTQISSVGLEYIRGLTGLLSLNLSGTRISDEGLGHLERLTMLKHLYLPGSYVSYNAVARLRRALSNCLIENRGDA